MLKYVLLIVGFILLIKGADFFVDGSSSVAKRLKVPTLIIGLTIVAMGTSLPECAVSISASLQNSNEMAYSNVVGSNVFNLMVVCGICALFTPLAVERATLKKEFPFSIIAAGLLLLIGFLGRTVGRGDGILLLVIFVLFLVYMVRSALNSRKQGKQQEEDSDEIKLLPVWKCLLFIIGGAVAVAIGGELVVNSATEIALSFGLSQTLIGLTIVAFGTSLPELVTSIVAAKKGDVDMAVGNVIGSNLFNILLVLGVAAVVSPVGVTTQNLIDDLLMIVMSVVVWIFAWRKGQITRIHGIVMLAIYAAYMGFICMR